MTQVNGLSPLLSEKGTTLKILPLHWACHWQSLLGGGGRQLKGLEQQTFFQVLFYGKFSTMLISARETPKALGQQNCWGWQNLLVPLPGDTWSCVCPGIPLLAWVEFCKCERLQTKGQCWHSCGLFRPCLRHITRVVWGEVSINNCSRLASTTTTTVELCSWISKRA